MLTDVIPCLFTESIIIAGFWRSLERNVKCSSFLSLVILSPSISVFFIFKTPCRSIYNAGYSVLLSCRNLQIHYARQNLVGWLVLIKVKTQWVTDKYFLFSLLSSLRATVDIKPDILAVEPLSPLDLRTDLRMLGPGSDPGLWERQLQQELLLIQKQQQIQKQLLISEFQKQHEKLTRQHQAQLQEHLKVSIALNSWRTAQQCTQWHSTMVYKTAKHDTAWHSADQ